MEPNRSRPRKSRKVAADDFTPGLPEEWYGAALSMDMLQFFAELMRMKPTIRRQLVGPTPRTAAEILGVTRQRVYQLIRQGRLEVVELWDKGDEDPADQTLDSGPVAVMITRRSIQRYLNSDRRPGRKATVTGSASGPALRVGPKRRRK